MLRKVIKNVQNLILTTIDTMEITIGTRLFYDYACVYCASIVSIVVKVENT